jgi:hypothetical protein
MLTARMPPSAEVTEALARVNSAAEGSCQTVSSVVTATRRSVRAALVASRSAEYECSAVSSTSTVATMRVATPHHAHWSRRVATAPWATAP